MKHSISISAFFLFLIFITSFQVHAHRTKINKFFWQADREILSSEYERAIANYFRGCLLASAEEQTEVWDDLGYAFLQKGELEKAKTYLEEFIPIHPENYNPRFYFAMAYLFDNEIDLASEQLEKIEKEIYFNDSWMREKRSHLFRKSNGKEIEGVELERIKKEKGVLLQEKANNEIFVHLDAFDERNEGAFYFAQGIVYRMKGEFKKAEQKFLFALKAHYDECEVRFQLIELYLLQDKLEEAEQEVDRILNKQKNNTEAFFFKGYINYKKGLSAEAITLFEKSLSLNQNLIQNKENIARIYFNKEKYEKAIQIWEEILRLNPDDFETKKKIERALILLDRAKRDDKGLRELNLISQLPHLIRFKVHHRLKNHDNDLILELHKKFFEELKKGKMNAAIKTLEKALLVNEQSFVINTNLALLYFDVAKLKDFDVSKLEKAEIHCARSLWFKDYHKVNKDDIVGCHDLMGNIYYYQKKYEKAKSEFKKILGIDALNSLAHYNLGSVYYELKDMLRAENEWKRAIECERKITKEKKRKTLKDELKVFLTIVKKPISFRAHMSLGRLYLEQELNNESLEEFKRAMTLEPNNPEPYYELGKIYLAKGDSEQAIYYYEKYLFLGGKEEEKVKELLKYLKRENF